MIDVQGQLFPGTEALKDAGRIWRSLRDANWITVLCRRQVLSPSFWPLSERCDNLLPHISALPPVDTDLLDCNSHRIARLIKVRSIEYPAILQRLRADHVMAKWPPAMTSTGESDSDRLYHSP
jgi:hypothetical protein